MKLVPLLSVIAVIPLLSIALQLPERFSPSILTIAYASTNVTGNNETENIPSLITTPPPLLSSIDQRGNADLNNTNMTQRVNATQVRPSLGNYTNGTALAAGGQRQNITGGFSMDQNPTQNQFGQNTPNAITGGDIVNIPNINITKEQAAKAEQEANVMINAYYEKLEQEKQKEKEHAAALAAAAQVNQTINNASQAEGSLDNATALEVNATALEVNATAPAIETEDDTDVEAEGEDEPEEDEENGNDNGGNEEEEGDSE